MRFVATWESYTFYPGNRVHIGTAIEIRKSILSRIFAESGRFPFKTFGGVSKQVTLPRGRRVVLWFGQDSHDLDLFFLYITLEPSVE